MATYAIGDIQGCCDSLEALVSRLPFDPRRDRLWFVGDVVNRGPKSLKSLRRIISAGSRAVTVLGNHDLHLLAAASKVRPLHPTDTLSSILKSKDRSDLIDWIRFRPLAHGKGNTLLVHAGVLPQWGMAKTLSLAEEVSARLKSNHWQDFMHEMYGNAPAHWKDGLKGADRLRLIINVLTRIRYLQSDGGMDFACKLGPAKAPRSLTPWFAIKGRKTKNTRIVFGHWSTLGLINRPNLIALDTGCVWGGRLTAIRLEDQKIYQQESLEGSAGFE